MAAKKPEQTPTSPQHQQLPSSESTNAWAIVGFIFAFLFPILGLIFSLIGLSEIKKSGEKGRGLAIAGIVLSSVFTLLFIAFIIAIALAAMAVFKSAAAFMPNCTVAPGFGCAYSMMDEDGTVTLNLQNKLGKSIATATVAAPETCIPEARNWRAGTMKTFTCLGTPGTQETAFVITYRTLTDSPEETAPGKLTYTH